MTKLLKAAPLLEKHTELLKKRIEGLKSRPCLKVVLVGENPASVLYTKNKKKFSEKIGIDCEIIKIAETIDAESFLNKINKLNSDNDVHGILIQLPLPGQLSNLKPNELVVPEKDVDGFHLLNAGKLYLGESEMNIMAPCTPKGIMELFRFNDIDIAGKNVVVIGRSLIVGKPMALMVTNHNGTVVHAHSKTQNLEKLCRDSDIIISAVGRPKFINKEFIGANKPVVIDVGINKVDGSLCGDVDFEEIKDLTSAITPVPGGVGPLTILMLAENVVRACEILENK